MYMKSTPPLRLLRVSNICSNPSTTIRFAAS